MTEDLATLARTPDGDLRVTLKGALTYENARSFFEGIERPIRESSPRGIYFDFSAVTAVDSAGVAFLRAVGRACSTRKIPVGFENVGEHIASQVRYADPCAVHLHRPVPAHKIDIIRHLGEVSLRRLRVEHDLVEFYGAFVAATLDWIRHPGKIRLRETLYYCQLAGADAMPIVGLMSFLMGLIMAFQAAVQLRQFGANIFVADLVSLAVIRELGPLLTAIIIAGRSGSAYAAEIGTMKVNEEIDALTVMGLDITEFLVLPKVYALAICGPLLTVFANASGVMGGVAVGVLGLDLTISSFMEEAFSILSLADVLTGLAKSLAFAVFIGLIGCFKGLDTHQGADSVGRQTTSAVVAGILLIIVIDAVFTVIFHVLDW